MELHANDESGRTTTFEIYMSVHEDTVWTYEVECNGVSFLVETICNPDPRHLVEAILDRYETLRGLPQGSPTARIREELDRGVI